MTNSITTIRSHYAFMDAERAFYDRVDDYLKVLQGGHASKRFGPQRMNMVRIAIQETFKDLGIGTTEEQAILGNDNTPVILNNERSLFASENLDK
jgi:hypothetical protein